MADAIAASIGAGDFTSKLPAGRELAQEFGVAYQTLRHAMLVLPERGLIVTRQDRGTFVAGAGPGNHGKAGRDLPQERPDPGPS